MHLFSALGPVDLEQPFTHASSDSHSNRTSPIAAFFATSIRSQNLSSNFALRDALYAVTGRSKRTIWERLDCPTHNTQSFSKLKRPRSALGGFKHILASHPSECWDVRLQQGVRSQAQSGSPTTELATHPHSPKARHLVHAIMQKQQDRMQILLCFHRTPQFREK